MLRDRIDKPVAGIGMALPARLQHVAQQEQPGQPKAILQILIRPAVRCALAFAQKRRQTQQPVAVRLAGGDVFPETQSEIEHLKAQIAQSELIVAASEKAAGS